MESFIVVRDAAFWWVGVWTVCVGGTAFVTGVFKAARNRMDRKAMKALMDGLKEGLKNSPPQVTKPVLYDQDADRSFQNSERSGGDEAED